MAEQLPLDFSASASERMRRARRRLERAAEKPLVLFAVPPNVDVHLLSPLEAVADFPGSNPEGSTLFLQNLVGPLRPISARRAAFPAARLDRLLWVRPPATVTLDAAAGAVARALWARELGLRPLQVGRQGRRLFAASVRWPSGLRVEDAPWTSIVTLTALGTKLDVDETARRLLLDRLAASGTPIARAGLAGSAIVLESNRQELLFDLQLPALSYDGGKSSGRFKMPLLSGGCLLSTPQVLLSDDLRSTLNQIVKAPKPLTPPDGFPWTLYPFQARDAGRAARILEVTGGVLLAGEMGSGKTTVALALGETLDLFPMLVVAPLSAFSTWGRQLKEMNRNFYLATDSAALAWDRFNDPSVDAVVLSYDRLHQFVEAIEGRGFRCIVADEVQRIRSAGSRRSRSLRSLAGSVPFRIGLSGTPLTNTINDLLPVGAFLVPGEWRPRSNVKDLSDTYPGDPVEAIAEHLGSMMVRRRMEDTGAKLPKRNDRRVYVDLSVEQRRALTDLEEEARRAKADGEFDGNQSRMHAFTRLQKMRQIVNAPQAADVAGPNPKTVAALELVEDFLAMGRKGVLFCADRATFRDLGARLTADGIGWVGIWGATPPHERIAAEHRFHTDPDIKVVLCTIQAGSESWSASPTATWLISTAYMYAPSTLNQMEARVFRMNSDPNGPDIEIVYVHASAPGGSLDDRMLEILEVKKHLFAQVVDRSSHVDSTTVHYSLSDLVYLLTGERDEMLLAREKDVKEQDHRRARDAERVKFSLKKFKSGRTGDSSYIRDDGSTAMTFEEFTAKNGIDSEEAFEITDDDDQDETLGSARSGIGDEGFDGSEDGVPVEETPVKEFPVEEFPTEP